jgi:tyrosyl-tRNA synthetase
LMQGYDSVELDVDLEIGGTDQTFNMLTGRTLQSKINEKEKFVLTINLLEDPKTGKKLMSKSEGDAVYLSDSATDMFGKIMSLTDEAIIPMLVGTTYVPLREIEEIKTGLENGDNPRDAKVFLAREIVSMYHGEDAADKAVKNFEETFSKGDTISEDAPEISVESGSSLADVLVDKEIVVSKSEFRRLIQNGAIKDMESGEKIEDPQYKVSGNIDLKIGKKNFVKLKIK